MRLVSRMRKNSEMGLERHSEGVSRPQSQMSQQFLEPLQAPPQPHKTLAVL